MPLQRETVARAALHLLDEVGLNALTTRRLAASLHIQSASLYWHFSSKQELLNCMAEVMLADAFAELHPPEKQEDWATWLANFARLLRRMVLGRRDGARVLAEADLSLSAFSVGVTLAIDVLRQAGFEARNAYIGVILIVHYVLGNTFEAQADPARDLPTSERHVETRPSHVDLERFPALANLLSTEPAFPSSSEAFFEESLAFLIGGLRAILSQRRPDEREN